MINSNKPLNVADVIRNHLAADQAREAFLVPDSKKDLPKYFQKVLSSFKKKKDKDLAILVENPERLKRLQNHDWFLQVVQLQDVGGWPGISDLPVEWCRGSITDVASKAAQNWGMKSQSMAKIKAMMPVINDVLKAFPPILVQGGEIRGPDAEHLSFDADDGFHRCIAAVLSGRSAIEAFVGVPRAEKKSGGITRRPRTKKG